jgi:ABC-type molybdate transport system substrate-binding protein
MPAGRSISRRMVATAIVLAVSGVARADGGPITIYASFALMGALDAIAERYRRATGISVRVVYGPGSVLTGMLGRGSNADILFTADPTVMDQAIRSGAVRLTSKVDLLASRLVLVRPRFGPDQDLIVGDGMQLSDLLGKNGKLVPRHSGSDSLMTSG